MAIYDDARLLGHFLHHYSKFGITKFFIAVGPGLSEPVSRFALKYDITVFEGLDVRDSPRGGNPAVTEMRRLHQRPEEWVIIVDLDEFVESLPPISELIALADGETPYF